jgi:hypothetical protein
VVLLGVPALCFAGLLEFGPFSRRPDSAR